MFIIESIIIALIFHQWLRVKPLTDKAIIITIITNVILLVLSWPVGLASGLYAAYKIYQRKQATKDQE